MNEQIESLYATLPQVAPPAGFSDKLFAAIARRQEFLMFRRHLAMAISGLSLQIGILVAYGDVLLEEIRTSPFLSYAFVLTRDIDVLAHNWQDALLAMLDMIPVVSLIFILAAIGCGLLIARIWKNHVHFLRDEQQHLLSH